ncbi:MAG: cold shock domain-containing protein [Nanoarchaeota archaeon]|nr:cold shock domain-containing protein [Nanoarchaeota archaeon]
MEGTVKWFDIKKGYGFINGTDGNDYFVHYSSLPEGIVLKEGESVTFEPAENEKGKQAQNVVAQGKESSTEDAPVDEDSEEPVEETEEPVEEESVDEK